VDSIDDDGVDMDKSPLGGMKLGTRRMCAKALTSHLHLVRAAAVDNSPDGEWLLQFRLALLLRAGASLNPAHS
jgi:hypothetical protein